MEEEEVPEDLLIFKIRSQQGGNATPVQKGEELVVAKGAEEPAPLNRNLEEFGIRSTAEEARQAQAAGAPAKAQQEQKASEQKPVPVRAAAEAPKKETAKPSPQPSAPKAAKKRPSGPHKLTGSIMCTNHPWRDAYATCDICRLNYCYADIMEYGGKCYCLMDIDKAVGFPISTAGHRVTVFVVASSFTILCVSLLIGYFMYPQFVYLLNFASAHGMRLDLSGFTASSSYVLFGKVFSEILSLYYLPVANMVVAALCFVAALLLFRNTQRTSVFASIITGMTLILMSYEYLASPSFLSITPYNSYQIIAIAFLFIALALIAVGRSSAITELRKEEQNANAHVNWPGVELY